VKVGLEFKPQDVWVGVYWKTTREFGAETGDPEQSLVCVRCDMWLCLLPCLPIHFSWRKICVIKVS
jgi:hypothetical protein